MSDENIHDRLTNKRAERFFETLRQAGVKRVVDVRLNNMSQLAGFSKKDDLKYFLRRRAISPCRSSVNTFSANIMLNTAIHRRRASKLREACV